MASFNTESVKSGRNSTKKEGYDPRLDFFSAHFDPLLALTTPGVVPPVPDAKPFDNLAKYESSKNKPQGAQNVARKLKPSTSAGTSHERAWLPHQLPVRTIRLAPNKNIIKNMETIEGPLSMLKKCKDERLRLKILMRHGHGLRGYCLASVTAFDKHWNLALQDVTEVWTRTKRKKITPDAGTTPGVEISKRIVPPKITITKTDKKTETCERHVPQMLVRGEHVVCIIILTKEQEEKQS